MPVDDTNAVTLTAEAFRRHFLFEVEDDTTPPDDAITLTVPALKRGVFAVRNTTAHPVTVTISGQPRTRRWCCRTRCSSSCATAPTCCPPAARSRRTISGVLPGHQDDGQLLLEMVFVRDVAFPEDLTGSEACRHRPRRRRS